MNIENQNIEYKESWRDEYLKWICKSYGIPTPEYTVHTNDIMLMFSSIAQNKDKVTDNQKRIFKGISEGINKGINEGINEEILRKLELVM
ncbi:MAG: hypothetical protein IKI67_03640 [Bacteroidales bacterium]|nr:hypothetical protein [Bacteroidales bacterium]